MARDITPDQQLIVHEYRFINAFQAGPSLPSQPSVPAPGPIHLEPPSPEPNQVAKILGKDNDALIETVAVLVGRDVKHPERNNNGNLTVTIPKSGQLAVLTSKEKVATLFVEVQPSDLAIDSVG